ncbi:MAG: hypothetical protein V4592_24940 [Bacteroidota bacterium]
MKKLVYCLLALLPAYFIMQGCNKLDGIITPGGQLSATKTELKINEPDTLVALKAKATDNISWLVSPSGFNTISTRDNASSMAFSKAGTYTVKASVNGTNTENLTIKVNETVYTPPVGNITVALTGDQFSLTPSLYKSVHADSTFIYFTVVSANTYCAASKLNFTYGVDASNNYALNLNSVTQLTACSGTMAPLHNVINFKQSTALLANGTYPLNVTLNGTTYTGSMVVSTANITFNWTYTSGVTLATKLITR